MIKEPAFKWGDHTTKLKSRPHFKIEKYTTPYKSRANIRYKTAPRII